MRELAIAAGMFPDLDGDPVAVVRTAAGAGFQALGLRMLDGPPPPRVRRSLTAVLDATSTRLLDLEVAFLRPDGRAAASCERVVEAARLLRPRHLVAVSMCPDRGRTADWLHTIGDRLDGTGVTTLLEFAPFSGVRTLADAWAVVADVGHDGLGVLVDNLHLARSGQAPDALTGCTHAELPMAQVADAWATGPSGSEALLDEAVRGRLLPGSGELPVVGFLAALPAGTPVSVEVLSDELVARTTPARRAALALVTTTRAIAGASTPPPTGPTREHVR